MDALGKIVNEILANPKVRRLDITLEQGGRVVANIGPARIADIGRVGHVKADPGETTAEALLRALVAARDFPQEAR